MEKLSQCAAAVFDMDGTLVDSSAEIVKCLAESYRDAGVEVPAESLTPELVGPPIREIISNITSTLPDEKAAEVIAHFRSNYDDSPDDISTLYDGIPELLAFLAESKIPLYVATNKPMRPSLRIVRTLGLDCFQDIYTVDKFSERIGKVQMLAKIAEAEHTSPESLVMIGDSPDDIKSARAVGAAAFGALWGYGDGAQVAALADASFDSPSKLLEYFKQKSL